MTPLHIIKYMAVAIIVLAAILATVFIVLAAACRHHNTQHPTINTQKHPHK